MNKIALIISYFGEFPIWMPLYLYSCSRQKGIDFIFYTDCEIPLTTYPNTLFHKIPFSDYCAMVSSKLNCEFKPDFAYKLCDLKPFYGIIHSEDLKDYEWWGFGDLDLVYGNLSLLINENNLSRYNLITTHSDLVAGHFTIIRKESKYTQICLNIPDWKTLVCSHRHEAIDEAAFTWFVRPFKYHLITGICNRLINYENENNRFIWWHRLSKLLSFWPTEVLMKECFTSFKPSKDTRCKYDLTTSRLSYASDRTVKMPKWGGTLYLHFLFFKKTPYWDTDQYWKEGFYKIPLDYDFSKGGTVVIDTEGIRLM